MGRRLLIALAALVVAPAAAPTPALAAPPVPVPLSSGWQLAMDPGDQGAAEGRPAGGGQDWTATTVPGVFDPQPDPATFGGTVGWYRITFAGPRAPAGYGWDLRFESVRRVARAWLNGVPIGTHSDPYVPFELPARGLRAGRPNTLVVRVDNRKAKEPREGWWNWGGIVRPVTLVPRGRVALDDPGLLSQVSGVTSARPRATVLVDTWLTNRSSAPLAARVAVTLRAPSGRTTRASHPAGTLAPGERRRVRFRVPVAGTAELWSPEHPRRYRASVETTVGGRVEQRNLRMIGLRTVAVRNGMLEVDGRRVDMRGTSIQEDVPGRGPALSRADIARIVAQLKEVHANVTRAHYLLDERLLDALDAAGILVWSQAPIYHRDRLLETPQQRATALATLRDTVLAARDHPSVIAHSVANELSVVPDDVPGTREYLARARAVVGDLDPTVPAAVDLLSYPGFPRQGSYAGFRLLGINSYFGWYPGKADHPTGDLADLRPYLLRMRRLYPRSAMVMTEFGAESTFVGPPSVKETYAFQSRFIDRTLKIVDSLPFMGGAIYWTLREFAVKPNWDGGAKRHGVPRDSIHNKGLLTYAGKPKPAWAVAERDFADTPLFRPEAGARAAAGRATTPGDWLLVGGIPALILGMLALCVWALRDIWRFTRPPEAEVLPLVRRRAA